MYSRAKGTAATLSRASWLLGAALLAACNHGLVRPGSGLGATERDAQLSAVIERLYGDARPFRYRMAYADLNADGEQETIVMLVGDDWCGTSGCTLVVLERTATSWNEVSATVACRPPVVALRSASHGWRDLAVMVAGGGELIARQTMLKFGRNGYRKGPDILTPGAQDVLIPAL